MDLTDFNCNCSNKLLENISKEQKSIFSIGDFDVNLMNYNKHSLPNEFLYSNTLIDKIFSNVVDPDIISGNLTANIADHLSHFE